MTESNKLISSMKSALGIDVLCNDTDSDGIKVLKLQIQIELLNKELHFKDMELSALKQEFDNFKHIVDN